MTTDSKRGERIQSIAFYTAIKELSSRVQNHYDPPIIPSEEEKDIIKTAQSLLGEKTDAETGFPFLTSIFSGIKLTSDTSAIEAYYPHRPVEQSIVFPAKEHHELSTDYKSLWDALKNNLQNISSATVHTLYILLQKYTSYIPYKEVKGCDISLFDHAKMLAAVSSSLILSSNENSPFLLLGGDLSGIQKFIYTITSKGALKTLRARSFYLELLTEHVIFEVLKSLNLTYANVIIAGGGRFTLLLPNNPDTIGLIQDLKIRINDYLLAKHHGKIYLVLEHVELAKEDISSISKKWQLLGRLISERKRQKFSEFFTSSKDELLKFFSPVNASESIDSSEIAIKQYSKDGKCPFCNSMNNTKVSLTIENEEIFGCSKCIMPSTEDGWKRKECQICHKYTYVVSLPEPHSEVQACISCANLYHIGEHLQFARKIHRLGTVDEFISSKGVLKIENIFYQLELGNNDNCSNAEASWLINDFKSEDLNTNYPVFQLYLGNYPSSEDEQILRKFGIITAGENIREFKTLSTKSIGEQKIGVLRMDVDSLGDITIRGFSEHKRTLTRLSALSHRLNLFFKYYLNSILKSNITLKCNVLNNTEQNSKKPRSAVTIYAGGDDLFIVGAWSDVAEISVDIHKAFTQYTGKNPDITLSGGFVVLPPDYPLYRMAKLAEEAEKKAKEHNESGRKKNALSLFYTGSSLPTTYRWEGNVSVASIIDLVKLFNHTFIKNVNNSVEYSCPRSLVYDLLQLAKQHYKIGKLYLPRLAYALSRRDLKPVNNDFYQQFKYLLLDLNSNAINYLYPAMVWVKLLNRR